MGYWATFGVLLHISMGVLSLELRCYCNLPDCIHTAYMCKSQLGCFQEVYSLTDHNPTIDSRIGCLELWPKNRGFHCLKLQYPEQAPITTSTTTTTVTQGENRPISLLRCCLEDMCNYVAPSDPELSISVFSNEGNEALNIEGLSYSSDSPASSNQPFRISDTLWFRAAVIGVPICGAIILIVLIILACSMLKNDLSKTDSDTLLGNSDVENCVRATRTYDFGRLKHWTSDTALVWNQRDQRPHCVL